MPTTILDGELLSEAYARRFAEEAAIQDAHEQTDDRLRLDAWGEEAL